MSHITSIEIEITDLDALAKACEKIGCEFVPNKETYKWFGVSVGDYPLPTGFTVDELGKCEHAIRVKNGSTSTYEVGVVTRRDGKPGYALHFDHWLAGYGLVDVVGNNCDKLVDRYAADVAMNAAMKSGMMCIGDQVMEDGSIELLFAQQ